MTDVPASPARRQLLAAAVLATVVAPVRADAVRHALVIGNAAYRQPLLNPVNDARAIAERLRAVGFQVMLRTDLDARAMQAAATEFSTLARGAEVALLFYAGHGAQAGDANYLLPLGAAIEALDAARIRAEGVPVARLIGDLQRTGARTALLVLDACREEYTRGPAPAAASYQGFSDGAAPRGVALAYAAGPGARARDFWSADSPHSPYTQALLDALRVPGLPLAELFARVAETVGRMTHDAQRPHVSFGETSGRLVLNGGSGIGLVGGGGGGVSGGASGGTSIGAGKVVGQTVPPRAPPAANNIAQAVKGQAWPGAVLRDLNYEIQMQISARPFQRARLEQRARGGDVVAQTALGYGLAGGSAGAPQVGAGLPWLEKAAARDFPIAQAYLAEMLIGRGGQAAYRRAARLLDSAAAGGFAPAYGYKIDLARKTGASQEEVARLMMQAFQAMTRP